MVDLNDEDSLLARWHSNQHQRQSRQIGLTFLTACSRIVMLSNFRLAGRMHVCTTPRCICSLSRPLLWQRMSCTSQRHGRSQVC